MKFVPVPGTSVLFCIWETRVQDFEAFVKATSYNAGEGWRAPGDIGASGQSYVAGFSQTPLHPVARELNDAGHSAGGYGERAGRGNLSAGQEFRLPTDAEWSRAVVCQPNPEQPGGQRQEDSKCLSLGNRVSSTKKRKLFRRRGRLVREIDGYADGAKHTAKVGSYTANRLGIHDLGGNAWEWCSDWFNAGQEDRVIRGASFVQGAPSRLLSSHHSRQRPGTRDYFNLGFRCVVTVGASSP
jgi:formylglycine-generating enzyme required for sulfatase activity